ncbi:2OG-Fe(II) oxygenase [Alginatibacterium sediminis]|uniref:2OG-Fe(II) oxygenase n=1 Tax=Alginatibacterium sediminis TaxID=2164068 RepID=UPI0026822947
MVALKQSSLLGGDGTNDDALFALIAQDIETQGYSIRPTALRPELASSLLHHQQNMATDNFKSAGIGRGQEYLENEFVRTDEICWINGDTAVGQQWLDWNAHLQSSLNKRLFLGLFSFESHFAHYAPGDYYKRHLDAFKGEANRVLSIVVYFNSNWSANSGGELVLYQDHFDKEGIKVVPLLGTIVTFLSEDFPHEVLPANRDRYSIAGWFRVNTSKAQKVDPPL